MQIITYIYLYAAVLPDPQLPVYQLHRPLFRHIHHHGDHEGGSQTPQGKPVRSEPGQVA